MILLNLESSGFTDNFVKNSKNLQKAYPKTPAVAKIRKTFPGPFWAILITAPLVPTGSLIVIAALIANP